MRCSNFILWLIPAVLLGSCSNKTEKKDAPSIKVSTEILAKDNACLTTTFVGQAEAASTSAVSFPTAGTILKVTVNEGQEVRKGQLLAEIDPSTMRKALKSAEAVLAQAHDAYDRMKFLHDTNSLPEIQWVEAQSKLAQAQAAYDIANKNLNDCRLYSPVNGTIGQKMVQAGETVMPGQPIVTIVDINTVKVNVSVPEKEIGDIKSDTPSTITVDALGKRKFLGGRIAKNVQSDLMTHTYSVSIEVDNPSHEILPGMLCEVIFQNNCPNVLTVPVTAIMKGAGETLYVWIKKDGVAKRFDVNTGRTYGSRIEIISGINENDSLIVRGMQKLSEGSKVITL